MSNPLGTPDLRALLKDMRTHATFFVVGSNCMYYPNELMNLYQDGHEIGLHTWTHRPLTSLTNEEIVAEIKYNEAIVYRVLGKLTKFLRPPFGDVDDRVRAIIGIHRYLSLIGND